MQHPSPRHFFTSAKLLTWNFENDSFLASKNVRGGTVTVNAVKKKSQFALTSGTTVLPMLFVAYIPTHEITLPLKKSKPIAAVVFSTPLNETCYRSMAPINLW